jgi:hypothetical protein
MDPLLWQQAQTSGTRSARLSGWNGHNLLYSKGQGTKSKGKGHHAGLITCLIRPEKTNEPTYHQATHQQPDLHTEARFFTMDIKNFYLCTPMTRDKYMRLKLSDMPEDIIAHYHRLNIAAPDGYVYCKICQGIHGLLQARMIVQELLAKKLKEHGINQSKTTPRLWTHK